MPNDWKWIFQALKRELLNELFPSTRLVLMLHTSRHTSQSPLASLAWLCLCIWEREKKEKSQKRRERLRERERDVFNSGIQTQTVIIIILLGSGRKQPKQVWMSVYPGRWAPKCLCAKTNMRARNFLRLRARKNNARVRVESRRSQRRKRSGSCQRPRRDFPLCFGPALQQLWASAKCRSVGKTRKMGRFGGREQTWTGHSYLTKSELACASALGHAAR